MDAGGGGTVAMYMANRNITTLDAGVPVLSHARALRGGVQAGLLRDLQGHESRLPRQSNVFPQLGRNGRVRETRGGVSCTILITAMQNLFCIAVA